MRSSELTIDARLARATSRQPLNAADGKSGSWLERVEIDGETFVVKHQSIANDWLMHTAGDDVFWVHRLWTDGFFDAVPEDIDHAIIDMAVRGEGPTATLDILMDDVGPALIPEGDAPVDVATHAGLIGSMASLHAAFWGWRDHLGLQTMAQRVLMFAPATIAPELLVDDVPVPIRVADEGWRRLREVAPEMAAVVLPMHDDPTPLLDALARTPGTFLHGDWKMGNLGRHPDGRAVLLDWAYLGAGPATWELQWYLALNRARLPESKEQTIERYQHALEDHGIATDPWFEQQLALTTIGMMVLFGWEKAVGDADELAWWEQRVLDATRLLP
jgi:hypothetical protein